MKKRQKGQGLTEYILILSLVAFAAIIALHLSGIALTALFLEYSAQ